MRRERPWSSCPAGAARQRRLPSRLGALGRHFSRFYSPEVVARGWLQHALDVARLEGGFEDEA